MIIGPSSLLQLEQTLKCLADGPLPEDTAKAVSDLYKDVKGVEEAVPLDNINSGLEDSASGWAQAMAQLSR